jgi:hypothetical protein
VEQRTGEAWQKHWQALAEAGLLTDQTIVSDQGAGLLKGCALMGLPHHPDLFHLLHPLAKFGGRFYRQALSAIAREYERGSLETGRSLDVINQRQVEYEVAKAEATKLIRRSDDFCYLWAELRRALELFEEAGQLKALAARQAEIEAILALMSELGSQTLQSELKSFAAGLAHYWSYYERAAAVYQDWLARHPRAVVEALACGWQRGRQATNHKDYGARKRLSQESEFYFEYAASLLPPGAQTLQEEFVKALDQEVRSSSLIENVNAGLRPLLETCRGQVDQAMLDLFAYAHNHRRFERGKRAGQAPIEILTGKELTQTWLESLLETA